MIIVVASNTKEAQNRFLIRAGEKVKWKTDQLSPTPCPPASARPPQSPAHGKFGAVTFPVREEQLWPGSQPPGREAAGDRLPVFTFVGAQMGWLFSVQKSEFTGREPHGRFGCFFKKLFKYIPAYFKGLQELSDAKVEDIIGHC